MPFYDYRCDDCGEFSALRRMDDRDLSCDCPECGTAAPRVLIGAPMLARRSTGNAPGGGSNEDASIGGKSLQQVRSRHSGGCACCLPAAGNRPGPFNPPSSGRPTRSRSGR